MAIRFGSVCSGIEAASVAWNPLGWEAAWFSEIEPFPCAVLKHHYPDVQNLGDMTMLPERILSGEVEAPDVFCGGTPCFTAGHMVLTDMGYKPIEEIKVGDLVVTHKGDLKPVVRVGNKEADIGEMRMVGHSPIVCTPDHPFLSFSWKRYHTGSGKVVVKTSELDWTPAKDMEGRQWLSRTRFYIQEPEINSRLFQFCDEKSMYLMGMYLGDGYIRRWKDTDQKAIILCLNKEKLEKYQAVFGDLGYVAHGRTAYKVTITDTRLADFVLENFGEHSYNKRIPAWVLSSRFRKNLLDGYRDTDGCSLGESGYSWTTVSKKLAAGITDLCVSLGLVAAFHYVPVAPTTTIEGRTVNQRDQYQIRAYFQNVSRKSRRIDCYLCRTVQSFKHLNRKEVVFNIEVEDDHSYIVEGVVVHNCQAFSIAGLRKSLSDARGNLSLVFCEIADAIDAIRSIQRKRPVTVFWENVPGVLNTKDNAFGCFLAGLVGSDFPLTSEATRWPRAGFVVGPKRSAAWRVLDAQYWAVAQRRKRVFVVASATGGGIDPTQILFERKSLPRTDSESAETRESVAAFAESSFGTYSQSHASSPLKAQGGNNGGGSETFIVEQSER